MDEYSVAERVCKRGVGFPDSTDGIARHNHEDAKTRSGGDHAVTAPPVTVTATVTVTVSAAVTANPQPRPSGTPGGPASQRRTSSMVVRGKRGGLRPRCSGAGGLRLSRKSRSASRFPWSARQHYCARRAAVPDGRSGTIECPALPMECFPRVLAQPLPLSPRMILPGGIHERRSKICSVSCGRFGVAR